MNELEIDGSKVVQMFQDGTVRTEDGRTWYWNNQSYRVEPHLPLVADGEWVEYNISSDNY